MVGSVQVEGSVQVASSVQVDWGQGWGGREGHGGWLYGGTDCGG